MSPRVTIASEALEIEVSPDVGGSITAITHRATGLSVLGRVPWDPVDKPIASGAARDEIEWLTRYTGGWPLLFPNGGDACTVGDVFHGFHGEASITPWSCESAPGSLHLARRFLTVPVEMEREMTLAGECLLIHERLRMRGTKPVDIMWGHHPTFGSDLLAGPVEITSGGGQLKVDADFDPEANPLLPGACGHWPFAAGKEGPVDLGHPAGRMSALAYLHDLDAAWIAIRRCDNAIAAALSWDAGRFPCVWLWYELGGTIEAPWQGRASLIGLEPNTTMPGYGIAGARVRGGSLLRLSPGEELATTLRLRVFRPDGPVTGQDI